MKNENIKLKKENAALKKENKHLWKTLNEITKECIVALKLIKG